MHKIEKASLPTHIHKPLTQRSKCMNSQEEFIRKALQGTGIDNEFISITPRSIATRTAMDQRVYTQIRIF